MEESPRPSKILREISGAWRSLLGRRYEAAWKHLETAHLLAQPRALPHFLVHFLMFLLAILLLDAREIFGQIPRMILSVPGSLTGRYPRGNNGRASMGLLESRP